MSSWHQNTLGQRKFVRAWSARHDLLGGEQRSGGPSAAFEQSTLAYGMTKGGTKIHERGIALRIDKDYG